MKFYLSSFSIPSQQPYLDLFTVKQHLKKLKSNVALEQAKDVPTKGRRMSYKSFIIDHTKSRRYQTTTDYGLVQSISADQLDISGVFLELGQDA